MRREDFDSDEEFYFSWYCEELVENGYAFSWGIEKNTFNLTNGLSISYIKEMKRVENKQMKQVILKPSEYTPDFTINWNEKALGVFTSKLYSGNKITTPFICDRNLTSIIEIKGEWDNNNMTRLAINNIKFLYDKHGIYTNLIKVPSIFKNTFTPTKYLTTNKSGKPRKIKYNKVLTLNQFTSEVMRSTN